MIWLLSTLAWSQNIAVPAGQSVTAAGPSVLVPESTFTEYLKAQETLPFCREALDKAVGEALRANERASRVFSEVKKQFEVDDQAIDDLRQLVVTSEEKRLKTEAKLRRARAQRNAALAVLGGLAAGAVVVATR